jgi:hypothetical protein
MFHSFLREWSCLTSSDQFFSYLYIMVTRSYFSATCISWWQEVIFQLPVYHGDKKLFFSYMYLYIMVTRSYFSATCISWWQEVIFQLPIYHGDKKLFFSYLYIMVTRSYFSAISWSQEVIFWWDDDVCFVLDQHSYWY